MIVHFKSQIYRLWNCGRAISLKGYAVTTINILNSTYPFFAFYLTLFFLRHVSPVHYYTHFRTQRYMLPHLLPLLSAHNTFCFRNWSCLIYAKYMQQAQTVYAHTIFFCLASVGRYLRYLLNSIKCNKPHSIMYFNTIPCVPAFTSSYSYVILYKYLKLHLNPGTFVQLLKLHNSFVEPSAKKSIQEGKQKNK